MNNITLNNLNTLTHGTQTLIQSTTLSLTFNVPTTAHPQPQPQMRDNYGRQYPPVNQAPVMIVHTSLPGNDNNEYHAAVGDEAPWGVS